jgi:NAD(P)-dependent dehydrogenase (short-subunit alcohol dehydrogenase family)
MGMLEGRVAIVTGASSGVGRGAALRMAEEGASVVSCARRTELLDELVGEIEQKGGKAIAVTCDVSVDDDIERVVRTAVSHFGQIDILANIAQGGMADVSGLADVTRQQVHDLYDAGPLQSLRFMQECFPYMKERGYGRIINTGSHTALVGHPGYAAYEMAKGAIMALTRNASQEWGQYGIVTNTILPVILSKPTDMSPKAQGNLQLKLQGHPLRRIGTPYEDAGPIIAFLASEGAGYLNGQVIGIDGGRGLFA